MLACSSLNHKIIICLILDCLQCHGKLCYFLPFLKFAIICFNSRNMFESSTSSISLKILMLVSDPNFKTIVDLISQSQKVNGLVDCFWFLFDCHALACIISLRLKIINLVFLHYAFWSTSLCSLICYELYFLYIIAINVRKGKHLSCREEFCFFYFFDTRQKFYYILI